MLLTHPDNLKLLPKPEAPTIDGPPGVFPLDFIPVKTCVEIPAFKKTGRLIWPDDPFVTYEESDRSWGVALGIAQEEVEPVFYEFTPLAIDDHLKEFMQSVERKMVEALGIPERIIAESEPRWNIPLPRTIAFGCTF